MNCGDLKISSAVNLPASRGPSAPALKLAGRPSILLFSRLNTCISKIIERYYPIFCICCCTICAEVGFQPTCLYFCRAAYFCGCLSACVPVCMCAVFKSVSISACLSSFLLVCLSVCAWHHYQVKTIRTCKAAGYCA